MTDKEKILAEIERLKNTAEDYIAQGGVDCICARGNVEMADDIIKFINSLPEEPVSEELEEAAKEQAWSYGYDSEDYEFKENVESFKEGVQWQKEKIINKACDWLWEHTFDDNLIKDFRKDMDE